MRNIPTKVQGSDLPVLTIGKNSFFVCILIFNLMLIIPSSAALPDEKPNYKENDLSNLALHRQLISTGSGPSNSLNYRVNGTIAQQLINSSQSNSFVIKGGFWQSLNFPNIIIFKNGFD